MANRGEGRALELLLPRFGRREDGVWAIQALAVVPLRPSGDTAIDFFEVADDILVQSPRSLGTIRYVLRQSIVPVVAQVPGEEFLRCLGTGFFISCSGLLVTAAHVITDPIERRYGGVTELPDGTWHLGDLALGVMLPVNPLTQGDAYLFREVQWATFLADRAANPLPIPGVRLKLTSDTAICKVSPIAEDIPFQPLSIVQAGLIGVGMEVGRTATAIGFGQMKDVELARHSDRVLSGDFSFSLHASTGVVLERFPDNLCERRVSTPGACFSASLRLAAGMSGSPIFDHERFYVHGVVSRGLEDECGPARLGYGSMLAHALQWPIKPLGDKTLLELRESSDHGFADLSAPGL